MPTGVHTSGLATRIAAALEEARRRTLHALSPLSAADLNAQPSAILSPLVWDLAHIGHQEELWLLRTLHGEQPTERRFDDIYNEIIVLADALYDGLVAQFPQQLQKAA